MQCVHVCYAGLCVLTVYVFFCFFFTAGINKNCRAALSLIRQEQTRALQGTECKRGRKTTCSCGEVRLRAIRYVCCGNRSQLSRSYSDGQMAMFLSLSLLDLRQLRVSVNPSLSVLKPHFHFPKMASKLKIQESHFQPQCLTNVWIKQEHYKIYKVSRANQSIWS